MSPPLRRALPLLAPALLAALAGLQIALAHTHQLSPWKGGGYGMFSTSDHSGFRTVRAYALEGEAERRLRIPPALRADALRTIDSPGGGRLERLAAAIARDAGVPRVRTEVWRLDFDAELQPTLVPLARAEAAP